LRLVYRPVAMFERTHFEEELQRLELGGPEKAKAVEREMKFEIQTENTVYLSDGKTRTALKRKWGPGGFLVTDAAGLIELQSEAHGFVEFETPRWSNDWCRAKQRIQAAVDMVAAMNDAADVSTGTKGGNPVRFVKMPFDTKRLKLPAGKWLEVGIIDKRVGGKPRWASKIQASESFKLVDFESYLLEHRPSAETTDILAHAKALLKKVAKAGVATDNLYNLLLIIVGYIVWIRGSTAHYDALGYYADKSKTKLAKEHVYLMSRTNFAWMFRQFLSAAERKMFEKLVDDKAVLTEMGVTSKTRLFTKGFKGRKSPGPTIHDWLVSIHSTKRDLLSNLGGDNRAMGRFPDETKGKVKDEDKQLVKFEARGTKKKQNRPVTEWVDYARECFSSAFARRGADLGFDPSKCP
jgi:hypothetical protein